MSDEKETITIQIPESFTFGDYAAEDIDRVLSFFDWSLKDKQIQIDFSNYDWKSFGEENLIYLFATYLHLNESQVEINLHPYGNYSFKGLLGNNPSSWENVLSLPAEDFLKLGYPHMPLTIITAKDREFALEFGIKCLDKYNAEYEMSIRSIVNELLYNTREHCGIEQSIPSYLKFSLDQEKNELFITVADIGIGIRKHLRQTYPNLSTDSEAILHSIKPQISGTFGRPKTGYETKNNAGVGLFFSSNIAQRLNADMFIVSGNGFVHISPTEIIAKELDNQWKGTFVYVKMKLGLIKDLNFQKMLSEITKSIPKADKVTEDNNLYISVRNYFGKYAEDKDLAKKIRDEKLLPALAENKSLTIDFEEILSAPHSLLNAMLATPIERLGLSAYKKIKVINAAPEIRETLDFIFDDNTSNAS